ncbi:uncharacterized protein J3D65DRAFT_612317 [Phyllosticta citribraziliensis]|uniref:Uncharacterized protein n=1 Tax=Phyllosticta citribraziliensis TaxID=989973 RepID=A0ABR1M353_9PEZI
MMHSRLETLYTVSDTVSGLRSLSSCCALLRRLHFLSRMRPCFYPSSLPDLLPRAPRNQTESTDVNAYLGDRYRRRLDWLAAVCVSFTPSRAPPRAVDGCVVVFLMCRARRVTVVCIERAQSLKIYPYAAVDFMLHRLELSFLSCSCAAARQHACMHARLPRPSLRLSLLLHSSSVRSVRVGFDDVMMGNRKEEGKKVLLASCLTDLLGRAMQVVLLRGLESPSL